MRTLAILAAILLFALLAQAKSLQETADDTATQEQPGEEDQDLAVSFEENGLSTLRASGSLARLLCNCRARCLPFEIPTTRCSNVGILCCH
ncbi:neutrophil defensin 4-like [Trachypithecus francoisi]|uniref:neutrophil defensin 4-like n=1 Tax=Trachypithecus francoisi TaxID=54180 RepID=UPI00141BEB55|nr:neutrophil defensin 4-like [Trachypithecus francoisi]